MQKNQRFFKVSKKLLRPKKETATKKLLWKRKSGAQLLVKAKENQILQVILSVSEPV